MVEEDGKVFFAGVINESEIMLEWSLIKSRKSRNSILTATQRGSLYLEFVLQQMRTGLLALTSFEANDIVANSQKNPLESSRRLQKRYDPTTG